MSTGGPPAGRCVIVRLTTRCCYECRHCCFECGPKRTDEMTLEVARQVRKTFEGKATWLNVMGGELTLLKNYPELLEELAFAPMRVVTNGWWVISPKARERFVETMNHLATLTRLNVGISRDRFHPEGIGDRAMGYLVARTQLEEDWGFTATKDEDEEARAVVPVGRAWWNELGDPMLRMFGSYCRSHRHRQSMTVLEDGKVSYCQFSAWTMGWLDWGFDSLEETRLRLDKAFFSNCVSCWRQWLNSRDRITRELDADRVQERVCS